MSRLASLVFPVGSPCLWRKLQNHPVWRFRGASLSMVSVALADISRVWKHVCVCVWTIWIDVKPLSVADLLVFTIWFHYFMQGDGVCFRCLHPTKTHLLHSDMDWGRSIHVPAHWSFYFWTWQPAKPRTGVTFYFGAYFWLVLHGCRNLDACLFWLHIWSELRFTLAHSGIRTFLYVFSESGVWTVSTQTGEIVRLLNWFSHPYRGSRSTIPAYLTDRLFLLFYRSTIPVHSQNWAFMAQHGNWALVANSPLLLNSRRVSVIGLGSLSRPMHSTSEFVKLFQFKCVCVCEAGAILITCASFSEDALQSAWQAQHFKDLHRHGNQSIFHSTVQTSQLINQSGLCTLQFTFHML